MDSLTITRLNQLNRDFYTTVAQPFNTSRQHAWPGWQRAFAQVFTKQQHSDLEILDLACGNARLATFLAEKYPDLAYTYYGVEENPALLAVAQHTGAALTTNAKKHLFFTHDILSAKGLLPIEVEKKTFDVVCCFGFLHHVASKEKRGLFFHQLKRLIQPNGVCIITAWQFPTDEQHTIPPENVGIAAASLEKNDYIVSWQREVTAYRYCHLVTEQELTELAAAAGLQKIVFFTADGKTQTGNLYAILQSI